MEFAATDIKLGQGNWTHELSFLAWQPHAAERMLELPEGAKVRVSMQWSEPHHPSLSGRRANRICI